MSGPANATASTTYIAARVRVNGEDFPPGFPYGARTNIAWRRIAETLRDQTGASRIRRCSDGGYYLLEGPVGEERYTQFVHPNEGLTCTFRRIHGIDREVRRVYDSGWVVQFFDFRQDGFFRVRAVRARDRRHVYFEGMSTDTLRVAMAILPNGNFVYFEGAAGEEHEVRTWVAKQNSGRMPDHLVHCAGSRGSVYFTHIEYSDGRSSHYEGASPGSEHLVKRVGTKGTVILFEGERHKEYKVEERRITGETWFYKGEKGSERVVQVDQDTGNGKRVSLLRGNKGGEYIFQEVQVSDDGFMVTHMTGTRGQERRKRALFANGVAEFYEGGERWRERPWRTINPDGTVRAEASHETPSHASDDGAVPVAKKQRVQEKMRRLWSAMEALVETGDVNERALLVMGEHFQSLNGEVTD
jgi:hypothetical protein